MERSLFKLLRLYLDLLMDGIIEFDALASFVYATIMRKSNINAYLKLLMKLGGQILSETKGSISLNLKT